MSGDYEIVSQFKPYLGPEHFTPEAIEHRRKVQERIKASRKASDIAYGLEMSAYVPPKSLAEANERLLAQLEAMSPKARRLAEKQAETAKGSKE